MIIPFFDEDGTRVRNDFYVANGFTFAAVFKTVNLNKCLVQNLAPMQK